MEDYVYPIDGEQRSASKGLTLRQYYAGLAMKELLVGRQLGGWNNAQAVGKAACEYADAVIARMKEDSADGSV